MSKKNHNHEEHHNHNHGSCGHSHSVEGVSGKKILFVTILNAIITVAEVIGGFMSGSLSLLSDAVHNFSDTVSIVLSYVAIRISKRESNSRKTYGYKRAEILAAFINSSFLFFISFTLIYEAYHRFLKPEPINGNLMITIAIIGLIANLLSVILLHKDSKHSMNLKSSYLHLMSDTISSVGVIIGGILIKLYSVTWVDPLVTLVIAMYILKETYNILKKSINILMQSSAELDYENIKKDVEMIEKVENIHHVHTWMSNEKTVYFEAHVELKDMLLSESQNVYRTIELLLKEKYGISHLTLQFEAVNCCKNSEMFNC